MKILVVEDDINLNKSICEIVGKLGQTTSSYDGFDASFKIEQDIYDLIILDVMLPNKDGFEILSDLRKFSKVPVLMLTAKDNVRDKVHGLSTGADDYLTKPFYRDELLARCEALIRRYNNNFETQKLVFKEMEFDLVHKSVKINNETLDITGKIYDILEYFVRNKEIIIPKEQLFNRVWGFDCDTIWSVVEVYVSTLRKTLKQYDYHKYLKTLRNVGYMWSEKD